MNPLNIQIEETEAAHLWGILGHSFLMETTFFSPHGAEMRDALANHQDWANIYELLDATCQEAVDLQPGQGQAACGNIYLPHNSATWLKKAGASSTPSTHKSCDAASACTKRCWATLSSKSGVGRLTE